jgi:hypothetical protein
MKAASEKHMRNIIKAGFILIVIMGVYIFGGMYGNSPIVPHNENILTNEPFVANSNESTLHPGVAQAPVSTLPAHINQGTMQVIRSLLGLEVRFLNGHVNYPGQLIVNDPRYQALMPNERLVDSIKFQPNQGPPFLLLIAIAKGPNGAPIIVPGKFDILRKTNNEGFVLRDGHARVFYYAGYTSQTPTWRNLIGGQVLQDQFCKAAVPMELCSAKDIVKVILKKPQDPLKDIPFLTLVK